MSAGTVGVLDSVHTPAEPGPGPISMANLRALDLAVGRRFDGSLAGDFRSPFVGTGTEFHQVRPYQPGDDVRRIDWNVTARTGEPHVRVELAERVLITWLVLDSSASMAFGTAERRKADVAEGVAIAIGHVATRRGNRLGVAVFGPDQPRFRPPGGGRRELLLALEATRTSPIGSGRLADALKLVGTLATQRSLVVLVSDFRGPIDWRHELLHVASRHAILAVEIRDPREQTLADIGEARLIDPETGGQLLIDTSDPTIRAWFAQAADDERQELVRMLASVGVPHVALSTEGDWLKKLAGFLRRSDHK